MSVDGLAMIAEETGLPYLNPEDGPAVLDAVEDLLRRFVAFPSEAAAVAVTLWAAHTHAVHEFDSTPRLALLSPEPGSGKSRTLEVLELLCPHTQAVLSASTAAVFRMIEKERPTLLFDEVDTVFGARGKDDSAEDLRGLLNAGHRAGAQIPRCVGKNFDVKMFPVFAAVALAGLGDLPDTLMSRSVVVRMRRRTPDEHVEPFRRREVDPEATHLRDTLAGWAYRHAAEMGQAYPTMPPGVTDRPADVWQALLAVADAAGGDWPERARKACVDLVAVAESREVSLGVRLLGDLRTVFGGDDRIATDDLLARLHGLDESPWSDLRGKPIDSRFLARMLRVYEVGSTKVKIGTASVRGYRRESLWDAWTRYLPQSPQEAEPPEPAEPRRSDGGPEVPDTATVPEPPEPSGTSTCRSCGQVLMLHRPGRDQCERCRIAESRAA